MELAADREVGRAVHDEAGVLRGQLLQARMLGHGVDRITYARIRRKWGSVRIRYLCWLLGRDVGRISSVHSGAGSTARAVSDGRSPNALPYAAESLPRCKKPQRMAT